MAGTTAPTKAELAAELADLRAKNDALHALIGAVQAAAAMPALPRAESTDAVAWLAAYEQRARAAADRLDTIRVYLERDTRELSEAGIAGKADLFRREAAKPVTYLHDPRA